MEFSEAYFIQHTMFAKSKLTLQRALDHVPLKIIQFTQALYNGSMNHVNHMMVTDGPQTNGHLNGVQIE